MISPSSPLDAVDHLRLCLEALSALWFSRVKYTGYAVFVGCAMELPETFDTIKKWWRTPGKDQERGDCKEEEKNWKIPLAGIGLIVIVVGIWLETYAEGKVSDIDTLLRSHESEKLTAAESEAASAVRDAGTAKHSADTAMADATRAKDASTKAIGSADTALVTASSARREADSVERDIVLAKTEAADVEAHLADALRQVAAAKADLDRIKTPRTLIDVTGLIGSLEKFKGTEYIFVSVFPDSESIDLLKSIDAVLKKAGWKRPRSAYGEPAINVYGGFVADLSVPTGVNLGVQVSVDHPQGIEGIHQIPQLPQHLQAGNALRVGLTKAIFPPSVNDVDGKLVVAKGMSTVVQIAVGKKP